MCDYSRDDYKIDTYDPYEYAGYAGYDDKYYGDAYDTPITLDNYDELMKLAKHEKTDDKLRDILYGLIKYGKIIKKKEIGFIFDYTIEPRKKWLDIVKEFNSTIVGRDYRILIDEEAIVCYVINDDLIK